MYYYKFKVFYDEIEDFVRDVEILATDNFESFYKLLYDCIGLKGNEFAAFSICDAKWNKQKEITLMDTSDDDDELVNEIPEYDEEDQYTTKSHLPKYVMADSILRDFVTNPHQNIMLEYDFMNPKVFYIELQKALETDDASLFPRCTYKKMEMPVQLTAADVPDPEEDELDLDFVDDEDDDFLDDGLNDEDFDNLNDFTELT